MSHSSAVAVDLGSSSGRLVVGELDGRRLELREVHRFDNAARDVGGTLSWDMERILAEVTRGLALAGRAAHPPGSLAVDTWGVDYVLVDAAGAAVRPARAYRDPRTAAVEAELSRRLPPRDAFRATGVKPDNINTVNQVFADLTAEPALRAEVDALLFLPDYVAYRLSGVRSWGWSIASTSGLARAGAPEWSDVVIDALGLEASWLGPVGADRRVLGPAVGPAGAGRSGAGLLVVDAAGHDTACAVHALPDPGHERAAFISCGSWSVLGIETSAPVLSDAAFERDFSNEVRADGGNRFVKNITGLWILQECQRAWRAAGADADIGTLLAAARATPSPGVVIDPTDPVFATTGSMPLKVQEYCARHFGVRPDGVGALTRLVLESLALAYARAIRDLVDVTGQAVTALHLVGGGSRSELLCQLTADATGMPVVAGPAEASAVGNIIAQLEATGVISSRDESRDVVAHSFAPRTYAPGAGTHLARLAARAGEVLARGPHP